MCTLSNKQAVLSERRKVGRRGIWEWSGGGGDGTVGGGGGLIAAANKATVRSLSQDSKNDLPSQISSSGHTNPVLFAVHK